MTGHKQPLEGLFEEMLAFGVRLETARHAAPMLLRAINEGRLPELLRVLEQGEGDKTGRDVAFQRFGRKLLQQ